MVRRLRIAFFGTPAFAVPTLQKLLESSHSLVTVVTQPDRPRGRGQHVSASPVKALALAHGIPLLQPERMKDPSLIASLDAARPDLGVVAAYGRILPDELLAIPRLGMINVHASLLPRHRGAAPVHRAVMAGDTQTGVTIMRVARELDAGPMLDRAVRPIGADETSDEVEADLARMGAPLLLGVVDALARGPVEEIAQDASQATYAPRLTKDDAPIDWSKTARAIHNHVRGLHPWPHAHTRLRERRLIVLRTGVEDARADAIPGAVIEAHGDTLRVATGDGLTLRLLEVQPEGKRVMSVQEFLAGHPLTRGTTLGPG